MNTIENKGFASKHTGITKNPKPPFELTENYRLWIPT